MFYILKVDKDNILVEIYVKWKDIYFAEFRNLFFVQDIQITFYINTHIKVHHF